MGMTPDQFFELFVEGNAYESRENPQCVRRAFNAAVALSQMADHNFEYSKRHQSGSAMRFENIGAYVRHIAEQTGGAFIDMRSIAIAYKHLYSTRTETSISSAGAIVSGDLADADHELKLISDEYDSDVPSSEMGSVVFTRKDGSKPTFSSVLEVVQEYWRREFYGTF